MTSCVKKPHVTENLPGEKLIRTGWTVRKFNQMEEPCSGYLKLLRTMTKKKKGMKFKFSLCTNYDFIYFSSSVLNLSF